MYMRLDVVFDDETPRLRPTRLVDRALVRHSRVSFPCCRLPDWAWHKWAAEYAYIRFDEGAGPAPRQSKQCARTRPDMVLLKRQAGQSRFDEPQQRTIRLVGQRQSE
ncbi:hypothetical protein GGP41_003806 [Bipolaris sorokiniana]|uniref:Uncharacterized protein n=1 Tax=Cochliobolus sativus TaxID=45130 RepID=A0A8H5ZBZ8_COCSA|nr:hypothetical protein GGP41_003806 [Bipolaris sorokiniana]